MASVTDFGGHGPIGLSKLAGFPIAAMVSELEPLTELNLLTDRERAMLTGPAEFEPILRSRGWKENASITAQGPSAARN